jgi:lysophospholipase L1-like esterase
LDWRETGRGIAASAESGSTGAVTRSGRSALRLAAVAVVVVLSPVVVAAGGAEAKPATKGRSVVLIGDSVMAALHPGYTNAANKVIAAAGWKVVIDAKVNRNTAQGAQVAHARRAQETDSVVVMLGHNDGATPTVFQRRATAVLQQLKGVPHVYWLTMREPRYAGANRVLRSLTGQYKNLRLIDWAHQIKSGWTAKDGLHLNGAGATGMAALILAALQ